MASECELFIIRHSDPDYFFIRECFRDEDGDYRAVVKAYTRIGGRYSFPRWTMNFVFVAGSLPDLSLAVRWGAAMHAYTDSRIDSMPHQLFTDEEKERLKAVHDAYKEKQEILNAAIHAATFGTKQPATLGG